MSVVVPIAATLAVVNLAWSLFMTTFKPDSGWTYLEADGKYDFKAIVQIVSFLSAR
jgi:hypothetical protein